MGNDLIDPFLVVGRGVGASIERRNRLEQLFLDLLRGPGLLLEEGGEEGDTGAPSQRGDLRRIGGPRLPGPPRGGWEGELGADEVEASWGRERGGGGSEVGRSHRHGVGQQGGGGSLWRRVRRRTRADKRAPSRRHRKIENNVFVSLPFA